MHSFRQSVNWSVMSIAYEAPTMCQALDKELENITLNGMFITLTFMGPFHSIISLILSLVLTQIGLHHIILLDLSFFIYETYKMRNLC